MLRFDADGWLADNTDGIGLVRDIERNAGVALRGQRVLLVGAGGAAAGVLGPLLAAAPRAAVVANRTAGKAARWCGAMPRWRDLGVALSGRRACASAGSAFDVVVNAAPAAWAAPRAGRRRGASRRARWRST